MLYDYRTTWCRGTAKTGTKKRFYIIRLILCVAFSYTPLKFSVVAVVSQYKSSFLKTPL